jgi:hypothetical protein
MTDDIVKKAALCIARESLARMREEEGATHTASLYRSGRWDEQPDLLQHAATAELALHLAIMPSGVREGTAFGITQLQPELIQSIGRVR